MNKNEFDILDCIAENNEKKISQRKISVYTKLSLGTVNKITNRLVDNNIIKYQNNTIVVTKKGYQFLEPYRVKRTVLLAAGFGSRMYPITLNTPKPMVMVHGKRIIESLIEALMAKDITEIYVVTGYLSEQFEVLKNKFPNIVLINNTYYNESNNISSAFIARDKFENSYICESDLLIQNKEVIRKYQFGSNYTGKFVTSTNDWCFEMKNGFISCLKIGGENVYHTYCIAYFDKKDGKQMKTDLEKAYNIPGSREKVWDFVALEYFKNNYKMYVREVKEGDIIEIDSFNELKAIDKIYEIR